MTSPSYYTTASGFLTASANTSTIASNWSTNAACKVTLTPYWGTCSGILPGDYEVPILTRLPECLKLGEAVRLGLPDGSALLMDAQGNYRIEDEAAEVIYRANRFREFNRYVSASDLVEEFIAYVGGLGVRREQFRRLPMELFLQFLIVGAAHADGDAVPEGVDPAAHPALRGGGRRRRRICRGGRRQASGA